MTYKSLFYPRVQTTVTGKVQSTDTYDLYYDMVRLAARDRALPMANVDAGELLIRKSKYTIDQTKRIPPRSDESLSNRYSGRRLDGSTGQGALYLASLSGVLREHTHYSTPAAKGLWLPGRHDVTGAFMSGQKGGAKLPAGEHFHVYRAGSDLRTADLRLETLFRFFTRYQFGIAKNVPLDLLVNAVSSPTDYSAARGMADAVFDSRRQSGAAGLLATSARADSDSGLILGSHGDDSGSNVIALLGMPDTVVDALTPVASFESFADLSRALPKLKS
jgi:hypothetical protein